MNKDPKKTKRLKQLLGKILKLEVIERRKTFAIIALKTRLARMELSDLQGDYERKDIEALISDMEKDNRVYDLSYIARELQEELKRLEQP